MPHISYISCRMNTYPEESICVGMILIDEEGVAKVKVSENKMKKVKKVIALNVFKLFKSATDGIERGAAELTLESVDRMHRYQNGILMISKPNHISLEHVEDKENFFDNYFNKRIDNY